MSGDFTFASLERKQSGRHSSCPVCGQNTAGAVQIGLQSRKGVKPKALSSISRALCERHAVQLYRELQGVFEAFLLKEPAVTPPKPGTQ